MSPRVLMIRNKPNLTNWSLENGYRNRFKGSNYPKRIFSAKQTSALVVFLRLFDKDLEYICQSLVPGFKIYLHTPGEMPAMSRKSFRVPTMEEAELAITPTYVTTSASLRSYQPSQRQCYFNGERTLRFFKIYAQNNCEAECLSNFTRIECGCVQFSMPSICFALIDLLLYSIRMYQNSNNSIVCFRRQFDENLWFGKNKMLSICGEATFRGRCDGWFAR